MWSGETIKLNATGGTITVPKSLANAWNKYGWPSDDVLRRLAAGEVEPDGFDEYGRFPEPDADNPV